MKATEPVLNEEGPQYRLYAGAADSTVLVRQAEKSGARVVTAINPDRERATEFDLSALPGGVEAAAGAREISPGSKAKDVAAAQGLLTLDPLSIRVFSLPAPRRRSAKPSVKRKIDRTALAAKPVVIQRIVPEIDGGDFPIKREVGDELEVWAEIFTDGHVRIAAVLKLREAGSDEWLETPMESDNPGLDRWVGRTRVARNGRAAYTVEAWVDEFETWREELIKKNDAGLNVGVELLEGRALITEAKGRAIGDDRRELERYLRAFDKAKDDEGRIWATLDRDLRPVMRRCADRSRSVAYPPRELIVDRVQARFAAWYEMFHRSQGTVPGKSATFADCERRLPEIRDMGFDVIYFVPIHPIGKVHRKGAEQYAERRSRRSGQSLRHRLRRGRSLRRPSRPRLPRRLPSLRPEMPRHGHGGRAGLRNPVRTRPPLGPRTPGMVQVPARRHHQICRKSAQEV